jgi:hypothetical protein
MNKERRKNREKSTCIAQLVPEKCVSKSQASCNWQRTGQAPLGKLGNGTKCNVNINMDLTISERCVKGIEFIKFALLKSY